MDIRFLPSLFKLPFRMQLAPNTILTASALSSYCPHITSAGPVSEPWGAHTVLTGGSTPIRPWRAHGQFKPPRGSATRVNRVFMPEKLNMLYWDCDCFPFTLAYSNIKIPSKYIFADYFQSCKLMSCCLFV